MRLRPAHGLILLLLAVAAAAHFSGLTGYLTFERAMAHRDDLLVLVRERPFVSALAFAAVYAGAVSLSLPIATMLTLLGGFLFGRWIGTVLVTVAASAGAVVIFTIARTSLGEGLRRRAGPLYARVATNMQENAVGYLLFLRLVPVVPFFIVNIIPAMFGIRTVTFAATTFVGIIPLTFVYANLGGELATISSLSELVSAPTLIAFSLLGVLALMPALYRQWRRHRERQGEGG